MCTPCFTDLVIHVASAQRAAESLPKAPALSRATLKLYFLLISCRGVKKRGGKSNKRCICSLQKWVCKETTDPRSQNTQKLLPQHRNPPELTTNTSQGLQWLNLRDTTVRNNSWNVQWGELWSCWGTSTPPENTNQQHVDLKHRIRCEPPLGTPFSAHTVLKVL